MIIAIIAILYYYITSTKDVYELNIEEDIAQTEGEKDTKEEETIIIHITGAVKSEGIVKVKETARINDVIETAGGVTEEADLSEVNLAYAVEDGQKIYIPFKTDKEIQEKRRNNIRRSRRKSIKRKRRK
ncbi:MAG: hypothetical protein HFJ52_07755 [Clostridia bacterium]|nr:hypothetical protein [Clostridia bacterium]